MRRLLERSNAHGLRVVSEVNEADGHLVTGPPSVAPPDQVLLAPQEGGVVAEIIEALGAPLLLPVLQEPTDDVLLGLGEGLLQLEVEIKLLVHRVLGCLLPPSLVVGVLLPPRRRLFVAAAPVRAEPAACARPHRA